MGGGTSGTVLIFPGRTEPIEKYGLPVAAFTAMDLSAVVVDWRGQGLADRLTQHRVRGHVGAFADYQRDVRAVAAYATALNLPKPWFLVAHSMGGAIGLRALMEHLPVAAVVFSGPMWGIQLTGRQRIAAFAVAELARVLPIAGWRVPGGGDRPLHDAMPFDGNPLTGDPEMFEIMSALSRQVPDFTLGSPTLGWVIEALQETAHLHRLPSPRVPCICFLGTSESIVSHRRIEARMKRWTGGELVMVAGGRHEVMMETTPRRTQFYATCKHHFARHTP